MVKDITGLLKNTESNLITGLIAKGDIVLGVKSESKAGLLVKDNRFSNQLQSAITKNTGVKGFMSTDELPHYGLTAQEKIAIEKAFSCTKKDTVVFVAAEKTEAEKAIVIIEEMMKNKKMKKTVAKKKAKKSVKKPSKPKKKKKTKKKK